MNKNEISRRVIQIARLLNQKNYLAAADGNISYRVSDDEIHITPSGVAKAFLPEDLLELPIITLQNEIKSGNPSSERLMHLAVYEKCKNAKAIVHAHPPTAIALSISKYDFSELPYESMSEVILAMGRVPFIPYQRPGTKSMGEALYPYLPNHRVMILSHHGALAWGESLEEAYMGIERLEHSCECIFKALQLGELKKLPQDEVDALFELRKKIGDRIL